MAQQLNHLGERSFTTYSGWRRACRQIDPKAIFEGDKEIAQAFRHQAEHRPTQPGDAIGEWDGAVGCVFNQSSTEIRNAIPEPIREESDFQKRLHAAWSRGENVG